MAERLGQRLYPTGGALALQPTFLGNERQEGNVISLENYRRKLPIEKHIEYLDRNWVSEGLSRNWYDIDDVGFSMKRQMRLLEEIGDTQIWADQVERDVRGFGLEYLNRGTVFPFEYQVEGQEFVDKKYGGRKMTDTVDARERNGAVLESLRRVQNHFLEGGSSAVMVSPPGWTNLNMDNGTNITYIDTMIFHFVRDGDRIVGTTFRTDFNLEDAKKLIKQLTGQELSPSATIIDCVRAIALSNEDLPQVGEASDLVGILEKVRDSKYAYKNKTWVDMRYDVSRRDFLYDFDDKVGQIINDFKDYVTSGNHTELEIQKALAATFFRLSKYMLSDGKEGKEQDIRAHREGNIYTRTTYGQIMDEVRKIPGCAGGGSSVTSVTSITERGALMLEPDKYGERTFNCPNVPKCGKLITRPKDELVSSCPHCGADVRC